MSLLTKLPTLVWPLVTLFGIYLPNIYIPPAQGRECYVCEPCKDSDRGQNMTEADYCLSGVRKFVNGTGLAGTEYTFRYCGLTAVAESINKNFSCGEPKPLFTHDDANNNTIHSKLTPCFCKKDYCNSATPPIHLVEILSAFFMLLGITMM